MLRAYVTSDVSTVAKSYPLPVFQLAN
jgi:hypothetical protein